MVKGSWLIKNAVMIDIERLRFDGKLNYQERLSFYFSKKGHVISFLVKTVWNKKKSIRVTMQPDINHHRAHVHINDHDATVAVDNGELLAGNCDARTLAAVQKWVLEHKDTLKELWDIAKVGEVDYRQYVERIRENDDINKEEA